MASDSRSTTGASGAAGAAGHGQACWGCAPRSAAGAGSPRGDGILLLLGVAAIDRNDSSSRGHSVTGSSPSLACRLIGDRTRLCAPLVGPLMGRLTGLDRTRRSSKKLSSDGDLSSGKSTNVRRTLTGEASRVRKRSLREPPGVRPPGLAWEKGGGSSGRPRAPGGSETPALSLGSSCACALAGGSGTPPGAPPARRSGLVLRIRPPPCTA